MLWLPKWLADAPPPPEGVTRRSFLFLAGATAASLVLPAPVDEGVWDDTVPPILTAHSLMNRTFVIPIRIGRNWSVREFDHALAPAGQQQIVDIRLNAAEHAAFLRDAIERRSVLQARLKAEHGIDWSADPYALT